jgi:CheY-like chemotaxis protein
MDTRKKILVVDDEEEALSFVSNILRRAQYEVISTTKGNEAVQLARAHTPEAIVLDVVMPDLLGGEVSKILSQDPSTKNIPIIFLSGLNTKEDEEIMRSKAGNHRVLAKPTSAEELLEAVNEIFSGDEPNIQ